jgi:microcin C transport system permease protein
LTEAGGAAIQKPGSQPGQLDPKQMEQLKKIYHLDRPFWERYLRTFLWYAPSEQTETPLTLGNFFNRDNWEGFLVFKFGDSFYRNRSVLELIKEKLPVSVSLGVSSFFLTYILCIVLGIAKAVKNGTRFDTMTSVIVLIGYSIPGFVMGIFLIVIIGPGEGAVAHLIPLAGLTSAAGGNKKTICHDRKGQRFVGENHPVQTHFKERLDSSGDRFSHRLSDHVFFGITSH